MSGPQATAVALTSEEQQELDRLVRAHTTPQHLALRARIILFAAEGLNNVQVGRQVGVSREAVRLWRDRWVAVQAVPLEELAVVDRLADAPRPGAPAHIGAEQVCAIVALTCEAPALSARPISQWTGREIADEIVRRGIVDTISPRHAARLVKRGICAPIWSATG
jgi:putative transposase